MSRIPHSWLSQQPLTIPLFQVNYALSKLNGRRLMRTLIFNILTGLAWLRCWRILAEAVISSHPLESIQTWRKLDMLG
jgi:hypothetical protein